MHTRGIPAPSVHPALSMGILLRRSNKVCIWSWSPTRHFHFKSFLRQTARITLNLHGLRDHCGSFSGQQCAIPLPVNTVIWRGSQSSTVPIATLLQSLRRHWQTADLTRKVTSICPSAGGISEACDSTEGSSATVVGLSETDRAFRRQRRSSGSDQRHRLAFVMMLRGCPN
jgi:hypothetical protein